MIASRAHARSLAAVAAAGLVLALTAAPLAGTGCSSMRRDRAGDQRSVVTALTEARNAVCACTDLACAERAERQLADFLLLHVDRLKKLPAPTVATPDPIATQAAQLDGELRACKHRLEEAAIAS